MPRKKKDKDEDKSTTAELQPIGFDEMVSDSLDEPAPEPAPSEPAPPDPTPDEPPAAAAPLKPVVLLDVFVATCGQKPDQMAGFKHWAGKQRLGPKMTIPEWRIAYQEFMDRPVR